MSNTCATCMIMVKRKRDTLSDATRKDANHQVEIHFSRTILVVLPMGPEPHNMIGPMQSVLQCPKIHRCINHTKLTTNIPACCQQSSICRTHKSASAGFSNSQP